MGRSRYLSDGAGILLAGRTMSGSLTFVSVLKGAPYCNTPALASTPQTIPTAAPTGNGGSDLPLVPAILESDDLAPGWASTQPEYRFVGGDCRKIPLTNESVDLIVTSPPYWRKRDYGIKGQIGWEETADDYVANLGRVLSECRRILAHHGNFFLNIGDTYEKRSLAGIPALVESEARKQGFLLRNRIIWSKENGMPDPSSNRLANRHEFVLHFSRNGEYYYDLHGYSKKYGNGSNPGDVWTINVSPTKGAHLAPFPEEIVERAVVAACPLLVDAVSGEPVRRIVKRTAELNTDRPQARRAMELAKENGLTRAHIRAIQSVGITDVGKARLVQNGVDKNKKEVKELAKEAKAALGGYFREFTFAKRATNGWTLEPGHALRRGVVFDPFVGTGTALRVARRLGLSGIGMDIYKWPELVELPWLQ